MIRFWLLAIAIGVSATGFCQLPTFVNAAEVINRGKSLYDSGKYKESIAQYIQVPKRDTGYVYMLSELALSYIANEEFDKALSSCEEGLKKPSPYRAHLLRSQAIATDRKGDYEKAIALYDKSIEAYPADYILVYNLGITYYNHKEYDKAIDCFFKVLSMNPFHAGSHLNLGRLSAGQGKKTHAMLSFGMYLGVNNSDNERLVFLEKLLSNQFTEEGSLPFTGANAFEKLDQIIRAKIAMDKNYKSKIDIDAAVVKQFQMLFDQLETASNTKEDRWNSFYSPIYKALKEKEMVEPFIFHILKTANIDLVKKYHQKNEKKLDAFYDVTNFQLKKKRALITEPRLGFDKPTQAWYYSSHRLEAIGTEDAEGKRTGKWVYFKNNFEQSAIGEYSDKGKKTGTWKYFNEDGTISSIEDYETGEVTVYQDGTKAQHFFLKHNKIHGPVELYDACGILSERLTYDQGKRHGAGKTFFASGKVKSTYTYDSNKVVGVFTNYFENGRTRNALTYQDDKLEGRYSENHANGKLKSVGSYSNDVSTGQWKYYHPNGRLESTGKYEAGSAIGEWIFYDERGTLSEKRNFDDKGKFHGENTVYFNGKVHHVDLYENDLLTGVVYRDTLGKQLGKFGSANGTFSVTQYYPTGQLAAEGAYKKGQRHGLWQFYFPQGSKHSEFVYEDGVIQGKATEYFKSGEKKYVYNYKDGEFDGMFQEYFRHGQLKQTGWFVNGERQQQWLSYYADGVLELDYYYLNGELSGLCADYNTTGKVSATSDFSSGQLNEIKNYDAAGNPITQRTERAKDVIYETKYNNGKLQSSFESRCGDYTKITKWFPREKIFYAYTLLSGKKEGPYEYNALNGSHLLQGNFVDGLEEGVWKAYYDNGKLDYVGAYLSGKHDSTWVYHFLDGTVASIANYKNDERNGITRYFGPGGIPLLEKFYLEGNLVSYRSIGTPNGPEEWMPFTGNAVISIQYGNGDKAYEEVYKNGVLDGAKRIYYNNGKLYSEYHYAQGDYSGEYRIYHPNGKLREKGTYKLDALHGPVEKYNEDGSLDSIEHFVMGSRNGKASLYEKGQKKTEYDFYGGIPYE